LGCARGGFFFFFFEKPFSNQAAVCRCLKNEKKRLVIEETFGCRLNVAANDGVCLRDDHRQICCPKDDIDPQNKKKSQKTVWS